MNKNILTKEQVVACQQRIGKLKRRPNWPNTRWFADVEFETCLNTIEQLQAGLEKATNTIICLWCGHETKRNADNVKTMAALALHLLECKGHPLAKRIDALVARLATAKEENKQRRIATNIAIHLICSDDDYGGDLAIRGIKILEQSIGGE